MSSPAYDPTHGFWAWSLRLGRLAGIEISLLWSLLVMAVFLVSDLVGKGLAWWWFPIALVLVPLSVLLHEFGHSFTSRAVGGDSRDITLWACGGIAWCIVPPRPLAHFLVAAGGPAVNLAIWGACKALTSTWGPVHGGDAQLILGFVADLNMLMLLFNLLPCYPMDGGRITRAVLWPLFGRDRAVAWTINLAFVCLAGMALWSVRTSNMQLFVIAVFFVFAVIAERRMFAMGVDPELGEDAPAARGQPWIERWRARRRAAAHERIERIAAAEQAELDRLLAKVSAQGLTALTEPERRTLRQISERERERAER